MSNPVFNYDESASMSPGEIWGKLDEWEWDSLTGRFQDYLIRLRQEAAKAGKWVPVTERLPEPHRYVLTWRPDGHHRAGFDYRIGLHHVIEDERIGVWWQGEQNHFIQDGHITHWMELPEGPAE